jgi:hypothetical protein
MGRGQPRRPRYRSLGACERKSAYALFNPSRSDTRGAQPIANTASDDATFKIAVRRIGPALVFERLWEETGCRAVIAELAGQRKHGFALERAVF